MMMKKLMMMEKSMATNLKRLIFSLLLLFLFTATAQAANLHITEYPGLAYIRGTSLLVAQNPDTGQSDQTPILIGSEADSAAFAATTNVIRVHAKANCHIKIGPGNPAATTNSAPMTAGATEYFHVKPGWVLSVISE
jgi:hypothetical protein